MGRKVWAGDAPHEWVDRADTFSLAHFKPLSARFATLTPKADIATISPDVRFVPKADGIEKRY